MNPVGIMRDWLDKVWYKDLNSHWRYLLYPLTGVYRLLFRWQKQRGLTAQKLSELPDVPVIVVGNITVGGTGKTPLTMALLEILKGSGLLPGVISRGYGGSPPYLPYAVSTLDKPELCGDEPLLICRQSGCPVVIDPNRRRALSYLIEKFQCNIVISDDGLQHHRLPRDIEIVVIDSQRRLGNGRCLPAGPLREPPGRLTSVDFVISNGQRIPEATYVMTLKPTHFVEVGGLRKRQLDSFAGQSVHAVAGIGNPQRFFDVLKELNISANVHAFPDHYNYRAEDVNFSQPLPLLMTAKDAVKCTEMDLSDAWYLQVDACLEEAFVHAFRHKISTLAGMDTKLP
jgi:tetraacyldisaccharide 4'-kinase